MTKYSLELLKDLIFAYEIKDLAIFKRKLLKAEKFITELKENEKKLNLYDLHIIKILSCKKSIELKDAIEQYYNGVNPIEKQIICKKCGLNKTVKYYHASIDMCDYCFNKTSNYKQFKDKKSRKNKKTNKKEL